MLVTEQPRARCAHHVHVRTRSLVYVVNRLNGGLPVGIFYVEPRVLRRQRLLDWLGDLQFVQENQFV